MQPQNIWKALERLNVLHQNLVSKLGLMSLAFKSQFDSSGKVSHELYDNGEIVGDTYSCDFTVDGIEGHSIQLVFPSETDNRWFYVTLMETNNTEYSYFTDFEKVLDSISK